MLKQGISYKCFHKIFFLRNHFFIIGGVTLIRDRCQISLLILSELALSFPMEPFSTEPFSTP